MLKYMTTGESHGPQLTAVLDGFPAGFKVDIDQINYQLSRRQKGYGRGGRMKIESDKVKIVSGVRNSYTLGGPITLIVENKDWENWTNIMHPINPIPKDLHLKEERLAYQTSTPRPGHADLPGGVKWNHHDLRNVLERASARETAARVALGCLTRQLLEQFGVQFFSHVIRIGDVFLKEKIDFTDLTKLAQIAEESEVRCLDKATEEKMIEAIKAAKKDRNSLGGVVEIIVRGLPIGLGGLSQWTDRLDGKLAQAMMSIQSVKGVEIGLGFESSKLRGTEVHDEIFYDAKNGDKRKKYFYRKTNNAGGLEGGMTNGEDIIIKVANKPISTLNRPLKTVDVKTKEATEAMVERTDNCVVPALAVICEASAAIVLADEFLNKFGSDNIEETKRNFDSFLDSHY